MYERFEEFLERPTAENYRRARAAVLDACEVCPPDPQALVELADLAARGRHEELLGQVELMMPAWALCVRVHDLAAQAAAVVGDMEEAELERFLLACCLRGILATGNGSSTKPYLVTYSTDAYDVLWSSGLRPRRQRLVEHASALHDVFECLDGGDR